MKMYEAQTLVAQLLDLNVLDAEYNDALALLLDFSMMTEDEMIDLLDDDEIEYNEDITEDYTDD